MLSVFVLGFSRSCWYCLLEKREFVIIVARKEGIK